MTEKILRASNDRLVLFPIKYNDLYELYKTSVNSYWTPEEVDLSRDKRDFDDLSPNEQHFIKHVLAFFAAADGLVNENILSRFATEVQIPEARSFYAAQAFFESIHSETYSLLIETIIANSEEKDRLLQGVDTVPVLKKKADWCMKWMCSDLPFAERLVAFACVEGIAFSGAFASIYWLRTKNVMHGLTFSNELIARDEGLHVDFACALFNHISKKPSEDVVHDIVRECVDLEKEFITEALPCTLLGMDGDEMKKYIQFVADRLLRSLGYTAIFDAKNPFPFMEAISLQGKTSFFERKVSEYSRASHPKIFSLDEEF
jgi:ribonucleoside-diphosphate reductase subunit M2